MKSVNSIVNSFEESIFSVITQLAIKEKAINLAQGFPDFDGPDWIKEKVNLALYRGKNQYAPSYGTLALREAIANQYQNYYSLSYDPKKEIVVTNGATEAIYCTIAALVNPGDEVVVFEPVYDSYLASLRMAQANVKIVTLKAPEFSFDLSELEAQVSKKTKLIILNNPHNPTGRVFTQRELGALAALAERWDCYVLSDEVYEFLTFDRKHIPIASLPQMHDRVITISSIGKTLSFTGWKIGWACGPAALIKAIHNAHQFITFCVAHPLQDGIAEVLPHIDRYLPEFRAQYGARREILFEGLRGLGFDAFQPQGAYFILSRVPEGQRDLEYVKSLIVQKRWRLFPLRFSICSPTRGRN